MLSDCSLSVTLVYCGQKVGWIEMPLGVVAGLGTGHIVLDGGPSSPTTERRVADSTFQPMSVVAKWSPIPATAELL